MRSRTTSCANVTTTMFKSRTFIEVPILNGTLDLLVDECNPSGSGLGLLSPRLRSHAHPLEDDPAAPSFVARLEVAAVGARV